MNMSTDHCHVCSSNQTYDFKINAFWKVNVTQGAFWKLSPFNSLNVLLKARISHKYKIKQLINCPFELLQKLEWMFLDVRLKGPISSQWGCSSEGKQRLKRGIRHLTWFLGTARLSLGTKSSRRLKLFQNTLHSLSNYRVCPNKLHDGVLVGTTTTKKKQGCEGSKFAPNHFQIIWNY